MARWQEVIDGLSREWLFRTRRCGPNTVASPHRAASGVASATAPSSPTHPLCPSTGRLCICGAWKALAIVHKPGTHSTLATGHRVGAAARTRSAVLSSAGSARQLATSALVASSARGPPPPPTTPPPAHPAIRRYNLVVIRRNYSVIKLEMARTTTTLW